MCEPPTITLNQLEVYPLQVPRNPKNAPGPFYVLKDVCISCDAPRCEAPGLVTLDDDAGCYFHRQPETNTEVNGAIRALLFSCIQVYRYGGSDPTILRRLAELGHSHLCDHPLEGHPIILRNRVRFSVREGLSLPAADAVRMGSLLVSWFATTWKDGRCTTSVEGDARRATFDYTNSAEHVPPRSYVIERADAGAWLVMQESASHPLIWLHDTLVSNGATGLRWFSAEEWSAGSTGQELPF